MAIQKKELTQSILKRVEIVWKNGGCVTQLTHALEQPPNHGVGPLH